MAELKFQQLHQENLLALYDVALDVDQKRQFSPDLVSLPIMRFDVRFPELLPVDSIPLRDHYCEARWKAIKFLERIGAVRNLHPIDGDYRWNGRIELQPTERFPETFDALDNEYFRRTGKKEGPGGNTSPNSTTRTAGNRKKVFVVHGRDMRIRDGAFTFLRTVGWSQSSGRRLWL
jgi:hypothetical protein